MIAMNTVDMECLWVVIEEVVHELSSVVQHLVRLSTKVLHDRVVSECLVDILRVSSQTHLRRVPPGKDVHQPLECVCGHSSSHTIVPWIVRELIHQLLDGVRLSVRVVEVVMNEVAWIEVIPHSVNHHHDDSFVRYLFSLFKSGLCEYHEVALQRREH